MASHCFSLSLSFSSVCDFIALALSSFYWVHILVLVLSYHETQLEVIFYSLDCFPPDWVIWLLLPCKLYAFLWLQIFIASCHFFSSYTYLWWYPTAQIFCLLCCLVDKFSLIFIPPDMTVIHLLFSATICSLRVTLYQFLFDWRTCGVGVGDNAEPTGIVWLPYLNTLLSSEHSFSVLYWGLTTSRRCIPFWWALSHFLNTAKDPKHGKGA